jgi:hypothetical protein
MAAELGRFNFRYAAKALDGTILFKQTDLELRDHPGAGSL